MNNKERVSSELTARPSGSIQASESQVTLGAGNVLEVAGLTQEQIGELKVRYGQGQVDLQLKAQELGIDVQALDKTLTTLSGQTAAVSKAGDHVTMTHSHENTLGRTEVIMGNTEKAASGKLTKSQTGEDDNTMRYVIIGAVVVVVALILLN
ncbi:hypothetical protein ACYVU7_12055 [Arenicellales bacterium IMCC56312]|jgi:hypothetical protein|nr:hypothetical protein [Gammaproteobacteria bacterium]